METDTIHPAEAYLRNENNPSSLYVKIEGKRRRLFINRNENVIGIIALGKRYYNRYTYRQQVQSPNQKIPAQKTKCIIETHLNIKQNVIFSAN